MDDHKGHLSNVIRFAYCDYLDLDKMWQNGRLKPSQQPVQTLVVIS